MKRIVLSRKRCTNISMVFGIGGTCKDSGDRVRDTHLQRTHLTRRGFAWLSDSIVWGVI